SQLKADEAKQLADLARKGGDLTTATKYEAEFKKLHAQESPKPPTPLHQRVQQQFAAAARLEKALDREVGKLLGWRNDIAKLEDTVRTMREELATADQQYKLEDLCADTFDLGAFPTVDEVSFFEGDAELEDKGREEIAKRKDDLNAGVPKLAKIREQRQGVMLELKVSRVRHLIPPLARRQPTLPQLVVEPQQLQTMCGP
ncbi:unnamed protein product, partial [Prorocentrum cordatum]